MKKYDYFIGIDVSKKDLAICVINQQKNVILEDCIENNYKAIRAFLKTLKQRIQSESTTEQKGFENCLFCCEHTGIYCHHLIQVAQQNELFLWIENPIHLKRSLGLQRGKNDKVDAKRIASYAQRFEDQAKKFELASDTLQQLDTLAKVRKRLVKMIQQLQTPLNEAKEFDPKAYPVMKKTFMPIIKKTQKELKEVEQKVQQIITTDEQLNAIQKKIIDVPGVGKVIALALILVTNGFTNFKAAKSFACYAGLAPFEHISGSSIRGKTRTSKFADKSIKSLLTLGALSTLKGDNEFSRYYHRKIKEGKHHMSVINAIRNKIIKRVFAIVKNDTTYQENYQFSFEKP